MHENQPQQFRVIGIDLHPSCFAAAFFSKRKAPLTNHRKVNMADIDNWMANNLDPTDTLVLEAGCNSFAFARKAAEHGVACVVLDSVKVGQVRKSYLKTDKDDAVKIAKIYLSGLAGEIWQPDAKTATRRELLSKHQQFSKALTRHKNMIRSYATSHGIVIPRKVDIHSEAGKNWLLNVYDWDPIQHQLIELMYIDLFHAASMKKQLQSLIVRDVLSDSLGLRLIRLCGIRAISAFSILAAVGDVSRFAHPKQLAAYLGLSPSINQSGTKRKEGGISKTGRKETRTMLIQSAHAILRASDDYGGGFKEWAIRKSYQKPKNLIVTALARKLAHACWYQLRGLRVNIEVPEHNLDLKLTKLVRELGSEQIRLLGYTKNIDFKRDLKQKMLAIT